MHLTYYLHRSSTAAIQGNARKALRKRRTEYISTANAKIKIGVTPIGGSTTLYGPSNCLAGACPIVFSANPGPTILTFTLTDGANTLSSFTTTTIVQPGGMNTLNFTANPVVNSVALQLAGNSEPAGTPVNDLLTILAKDIDGNTIAGPAPYVDSIGNPVTLSLSVTNNQAGGAGTVTIQGPTLVTSPQYRTIYAHYDGKWLNSSTINVGSSSNAVTALTGVTMTAAPAAYNYAANVSGPEAIVSGPDGNLWYTGDHSPSIGRMTPNGVTTIFPVPGSSGPNYICVGPDGNIWFTEYNNDTFIGKITVRGSVTEYPTGQAPQHYGGITAGPDGNIWYATDVPDTINSMSLTGTVKTFTTGITSGWLPAGVTVGPDGNIWTEEDGNNTIVRTTTSGVSTSFTYAGAAPTTAFGQIVSGPDGNLWFTTADGRIGASTPNGLVSRYTVGLNAAPLIDGMAVGPDGNIWFADEGTPSAIGVINIATKQIIEYTSGVPSGGDPTGMTLGPDGNIWTVEWATNQITKFVF